MSFKHYQSRLSQLSARFNLMVSLVFGLLIANVILSVVVWQVWKHHTIEITPFSQTSSYLKSSSSVDGYYLSLMSENFIYSRLNVTPETIDENHKRLLKFADSQSYPQMLALLNKEAQLIKEKKISSNFEITQIKTNPDALTANVSGVLKRYVGLRALKDIRTTYELTFSYHQGHLSILSFNQLKETPNA